MGKIKLSVQIKKADGTTVVQPLHNSREIVRIDKNKEAMFVDLDGDITSGKLVAFIDNHGFFKIKKDNEELGVYIDYRKLFGWCYTEERV